MIWMLPLGLWLAVQPASGTAGAESELAAIEHGLIEAWTTGDRAFIDGALSDRWAVIDAAGTVRSKQEVLAELDRGDLRVDAGKVEDLDVRTFGDTAVVRGRSHSTGAYKGVSMTVALRFTDVFVRENGRWVCVASHATGLAQ